MSMFFFSVSGRAMSHWAPTTWPTRKSLRRTSILPLSILARSRMSLIISKQRAARLLDVLHVTPLLLVQGSDRGQHLAEAENAVQRSAQLVAHRGQEVALHGVHLVQPHVGLGQFVDLAVQGRVDLAEFLLGGDQVAQHAVEGDGQLLEFVAGVDVRPQGDVAAADRVADVAEVPQRLDDHVADDDVGSDHRQEDGDDGGGDENGRVLVEFPLDGAGGNGQLGDVHHVALRERLGAGGGDLAGGIDLNGASIGAAAARVRLVTGHQARGVIDADRLVVLVLAHLGQRPLAELGVVGVGRLVGLFPEKAVAHSSRSNLSWGPLGPRVAGSM